MRRTMKAMQALLHKVKMERTEIPHQQSLLCHDGGEEEVGSGRVSLDEVAALRCWTITTRASQARRAASEADHLDEAQVGVDFEAGEE